MQQNFFFCRYESDLLTLEPDDYIVKEFKDKKKKRIKKGKVISQDHYKLFHSQKYLTLQLASDQNVGTGALTAWI